MRIALAQMAPALGDLESNLRLHRSIVQSAQRKGADLVVFPELSLTGYLLQDLVPEVARSVDDAREVTELLNLSRRIGIVFGLVEVSRSHRFYNTALFLHDGKILHRHRKVYLPTYGMFDEGREFAAGKRFKAFSTPWGRFGLLICEDAWHPSSSFLLAQDEAEILLVLSSAPSRGAGAGGRLASLTWWLDLCRVTAKFQTVYVAYVNRVGVEEGLHFSGGSAVVDPLGEIAAKAPALKESLVTATLSSKLLRRARILSPLLRDERNDLVLKELARIAGWKPLGLSEHKAKRGSPTRPFLARGRLG